MLKKIFIVCPEILAAMFICFEILRAKRPEPELSRILDEYRNHGLHEDDAVNLERILQQANRLRDTKKDFMIPILIAMSSLFAGIAEIENYELLLLLMFLGCILMGVEYQMFQNLNDHNWRTIYTIHALLSIAFILSTAATKLYLLVCSARVEDYKVFPIAH